MRIPIRMLSYCVMPNHWHLVLWPDADCDLAAFMRLLTTTHVRRWRLHRQSVGQGQVYQGTYKSFPVQTDEHLLTVCRHVERNPVRAGLVERAETWPWSSAHVRALGTIDPTKPTLTQLPVEVPPDWRQFVDTPLRAAEIEACRRSAERGQQFGCESWTAAIANQLKLQATLRNRGRPRRNRRDQNLNRRTTSSRPQQSLRIRTYPLF